MSAGQALADLRFDATTVQLGKIRCGPRLVQVFPFRNNGPGVVELLEARPGCGCLKSRLEQPRLAPGESGLLSLEIDTLGQAAGPHTWQLTVVYRDGEQRREQVLQMTADVFTEVSVQPAAVTLFAQGPLTHELTLTDLRPQPLLIVQVETTSTHLRAHAGPFHKDLFGHFTSKIQVEVDGSLPPGRHDETVIIHTDDPLYREIKVAVSVVKRV
jgi:hypothetical protein